MLIDRRLIRHFDWGLIGITLLIPLVGLIVLYSAGYDPEDTQKIFSFLPFETHSPSCARQVIFIIVGLIAIGAGVLCSPQLLSRLAIPLYGLCVFLLVLVAVVGSKAKGSQRWLDLGPISFQPSEMMKLTMILCMAWYLARNVPRPGGYGFLQLIVPTLIFGVPMLLIVGQPDLGTAMAIATVGVAMVLFMGIRIKALLIMVCAVALAVAPAWQWGLHDYQKRRVMVLFNPESDPRGSGYHIIQSKIAVGSGSFFGKGFMQGTQTQLEFLPEHTTDFIFSVLAEEWGFAGCFLVVCLYCLLVYRLLRVVLRSKEIFPALVALGIAAQIFFNAAINIGMVIGLLPVVGIPLPLFSYGGTSLISTMFAIGIVLGISMRRLSYLTG